MLVHGYKILCLGQPEKISNNKKNSHLRYMYKCNILFSAYSFEQALAL